MKFLHISDLHIGKRVNEFPMIEDQRHILKQILGIAERERADAVLIAGDIYDKAVPSAEAVQVFDWFLTGLADRGMKVFAVSGNHDSPERVAFGAQLMQGRGVYLSPVYEGNVEGISLRDSYGELQVWLLPFVKPAAVRHALEAEREAEGPENCQGAPGAEHEAKSLESGQEVLGAEREAESLESGQDALGAEREAETPESYHDAVRIAVRRMKIDDKKRNILVAHQFVTGAGRCDSEETVVGGLDNVDGSVFKEFDYVALGHIHSPQSVGRDTVRYCGTPLKYSFSEAEQVKSVTVLEMKGKGDVSISTVPLVPLHDMRRIRGTYMEVTARSFYRDFEREDYVQVTLTDEEDVPDGLQKLRTIYPNLMRLVYDNSRTRRESSIEAAEELEKRSEQELFGEFYELQNNQPMSAEQENFVKKMFESLREEDGGGKP